MKLKEFKIFSFLLFLSYNLFSQSKVSGFIYEKDTEVVLKMVEVYDIEKGLITTSSENGYYEFYTSKDVITLVFVADGYQFIEKSINLSEKNTLNIYFSNPIQELSEVVVKANNKKVFQLGRLKDIEGTAIFAGKKSEVISMDLSMANLASNNARQIYNQIAGLNIFQNDDAGLQLNIGGRGLDPNRTSNFNTRQNGYDISADALGYPESYYTPPAEALKEINIVRGAASLQYGTQFGGLVDFKIKDPEKSSELEIISRNTLGSNSLYTNFTSFSGSKNKLSYYSFLNYKKGNGFRPNSDFESINYFIKTILELSPKTSISTELTYLKYLAHQAGGLSDKMFLENPFQSNRSRNWFGLNWFLYNLKLEHQINTSSNLSFSFFGLNASRDALGFRTNRVDQIDVNFERDLIKGEFSNYGFESRYLNRYSLGSKNSVFLIGMKFYNSNNDSEQGPGSSGSDANFKFYNNDFPNYFNQSKYNYPNVNLAFFGENIFYLSEKFSITPGFRFEYIKTKSDGFYKKVNVDAAGNVILNQTIDDSETRKRNFVLLGLGASYKVARNIELYSNISENYRSVTFADISISNPAFSINPEISDENGSTFDFGVRGDFKKQVSFDIGFFSLFYNDRIGFIQKAFSDGRVKSEKGNVGNAIIYGFESLIDFDINEIFIKNNDVSMNFFVNSSLIKSEYTKSEVPGVQGKEVEFVPNLNLKTGLKYGIRDLVLNLQYTYLSKQFTDASNAVEGNLSGVIGQIPKYSILDFSASYTFKKIKLETGINNVLNEYYFTRRATGYPGPGIIPSEPRSYYLTIQVKL
ncbi:MAG: TonB-dependent receptor [Flavobacteriaceae bacterium]|nr:TonB-dependent receptor [Flavobacteriaceae bacterium]